MDKKLYLQRNWDGALSWYKNLDLKYQNGVIFSGRNKEQERINDFLSRRNQGSLLVSGDRGSGKTSLVIKTVFFDNRENVLPVCVDAIRLEALKQGDESFLNLTHLLRQLIKSLNRELKRKGVEYSFEEFIGDIDATEIVQRYKKSFTEGTQGKVGVTAGVGIGGLEIPVINLSGGLESELSACYKRDQLKEKIIEKRGLTVEDLVDKFSNSIQEIEEIIKKKQKTKNTTVNTDKDDKKTGWPNRLVGFLKTNFSRVLEKKDEDSNSVDCGNKIVFIIDELDFYDDKEGDINYILDTLKKFKNLFTLSNAQFIFIVGKNTYLKTLDRDKDMYRTLFSDKVFLPSPSGKDLSNYLEKIIKKDFNSKKLSKAEKTLKELWEAYKFLLIQASNHNYYNLIQQVRSAQKGDGDQKRIYLELKKLKESEKFLSKLHILLSSIHEHYQKESLYWHINDEILNALYEIEKSYMDWADTREGGISIWLRDQDEEGAYSDLEKEARKEVKTAFVRSIYNLRGKPIPDNIEKEKQIVLSWDDLSSSVGTVSKGLKGPITEEDYEFADIYNNLFYNAQGVVDLVDRNIDNKNFGDTIQSLIDNDIIDFTEEQSNEIKKANEEIRRKILPNRDYLVIKSAIHSLHNLESQFSNLIIDSKNKNIFVKNYGNIEYDEKNNKISILFDESPGNRFLSKLTLVNKNIPTNNFNLKFKAKLNEEDSILNVLVITKEGPNDEESRYHMIRLDAREPSSMVGDGILLKELHGGWGYVDKLEDDRKGSISGDWYTVEVENDDNKLVFWKRTEEKSKRRNKIAEITGVRGEDIRIGFATEKNGAELKDIRLSF